MKLKNLSIRGKLYLLAGGGATVALLLASLVFSWQHISTFRQHSVNRLQAVGDILAANTIAAITRADTEAASEVLMSLERDEDITAAGIILNDGEVFARYTREGLDGTTLFCGSGMQSPGYTFDTSGALEMYVPIADGDESRGMLYLRSDMDELYRNLGRYALMVVLVIAASLLVALMFSSHLQRVIAVPIRRLAETAKQISGNHDYSVRVAKPANDEIGLLYDAFNAMLGQIENGERELIEARQELEARVRKRTSQLTREVEENQRIIEENQRMQRRLIDASRQAGMAEVATGVLHNVGNVLNSVNVSANLVIQKIQESRLRDLTRLADVVNGHADDLPAFAAGRQGSLLPRMLEQLGHCLTDERQAITGEVRSLQRNIDHIKKIVSAQQSYGSLFGVSESLNLEEILNDAISIGGGSLDRHNITIERDFSELPEITADRHQLMQILVNLIRNAGQAIRCTRQSGGKIVLRAVEDAGRGISIEVIDNGVGIDEPTLSQIFLHGFTTKKDGHGYGLHSAALAARELGGSLEVHSDGPGRGATFTLRLPFPPVAGEPSRAPLPLALPESVGPVPPVARGP